MFERMPEARTAYCSECGCDREARLMHKVAENGLPYKDLVCNVRGKCPFKGKSSSRLLNGAGAE